jgi:hypothetical protein
MGIVQGTASSQRDRTGPQGRVNCIAGRFRFFPRPNAFEADRVCYFQGPWSLRFATNWPDGQISLKVCPFLVEKALQIRFGDQSLRYAYPLASSVIEQSTDPTQRMLTLRTTDGCSVCFSMPRDQQSELGEALVAQPAQPLTMRANYGVYSLPSPSPFVLPCPPV